MLLKEIISEVLVSSVVLWFSLLILTRFINFSSVVLLGIAISIALLVFIAQGLKQINNELHEEIKKIQDEK